MPAIRKKIQAIRPSVSIAGAGNKEEWVMSNHRLTGFSLWSCKDHMHAFAPVANDLVGAPSCFIEILHPLPQNTHLEKVLILQANNIMGVKMRLKTRTS